MRHPRQGTTGQGMKWAHGDENWFPGIRPWACEAPSEAGHGGLRQCHCPVTLAARHSRRGGQEAAPVNSPQMVSSLMDGLRPPDPGHQHSGQLPPALRAQAAQQEALATALSSSAVPYSGCCRPAGLPRAQRPNLLSASQSPEGAKLEGPTVGLWEGSQQAVGTTAEAGRRECGHVLASCPGSAHPKRTVKEAPRPGCEALGACATGNQPALPQPPLAPGQEPPGRPEQGRDPLTSPSPKTPA